MITLADIFQNNMVLQREKPIKIWGKSDREEYIHVALGSNELYSGRIPQGRFEVFLPPVSAMEDMVLTIKNNKEVLCERTGIDVGEVWIAGGQSNMDFPLEYEKEALEVLPTVQDSHLRFYNVGEYTFEGEKEEGLTKGFGWDQWYKADPESAKRCSAVGYYFAAMLRKSLNVPVGIVGCNHGGTSAFAWLDKEMIRNDIKLGRYLKEYEEGIQKLDLETYYQKNDLQRKRNANPDSYHRMRALYKENKNPCMPLLMKLSRPILSRLAFGGIMGPRDQNRPGIFYENMVSRISGFATRGVIWYQGESDDDNGFAHDYGRLFAKVIECWRRDWGEDLPFLFVQLAPYGEWLAGKAKEYPVIRFQQEMVSKQVPNSWMASVMDVGMKYDIHPKQKRVVGERLALLARNKVYGEDVACLPPEADEMQIRENHAVIHFHHAYRGMECRGKQTESLKIWADGVRVRRYSEKISGELLDICAEPIRNAGCIRVELATDNYCVVNLYNSEGLPAKPFQMEKKK